MHVLRCGFAVPLGLVGVVLSVAYVSYADLPPVPVPAENPITEPKRVLGKILFWDEQLSTSNTMACGTCHTAGGGGSDPRGPGIHPGLDGQLGTPDDARGSRGVIRSTYEGDYRRDATFGVKPQSTGRSANSVINAAYAPALFWDGRATSQFIDPQTGQVSIASGGGLESQAVGPPTSDVEMGHEDISWDDLVAKLAGATPLALARELPADVEAALAGGATYPELFSAAFGDGQITSERVAFAIATYERTLISDQTPYDAWIDGDAGALTSQQVQGFDAFVNGNCAACHTDDGGEFTDHSFRAIGLRPIAEDAGRQVVTGDPDDRGKFKTPGLRNVALKRTFMHNGMFTNLEQVVRFYAQTPDAPPIFFDNVDFDMLVVVVDDQDIIPMVDFMENALTDPRVAAQTFPFDKPALFSDRHEDQASVVGGGVAGANGVPAIISSAPPMVGSAAYRTGVADALPGALATLGMSRTPPAGGVIATDMVIGQTIVGGDGVGTVHWPLDPKGYAGGDVIYLQWSIADPGAVGGVAKSLVARVPVFCGRTGCRCVPDVSGDGAVDTNDFFAFLALFQANDAGADFAFDGVINSNDFFAFLAAYQGGC